jgi:hypothetical protein
VSGSVKRFGSKNFMGCVEMGDVNQALLEPVAVESRDGGNRRRGAGEIQFCVLSGDKKEVAN